MLSILTNCYFTYYFFNTNFNWFSITFSILFKYYFIIYIRYCFLKPLRDKREMLCCKERLKWLKKEYISYSACLKIARQAVECDFCPMSTKYIQVSLVLERCSGKAITNSVVIILLNKRKWIWNTSVIFLLVKRDSTNNKN